jgi:UDP-2,3-diacylglucosamine pyrophosphatase LpxH
MTTPLRFDHVYLISDIHLGGASGAQIFGSGRALAWLAGTQLRTQDPQRPLALVINGDFVDFLAEPGATHFDPHHAVSKLERIAFEEAEFAPVFKALGEFVRTPNRHLVINLGNHDIELALPWVRRRLVEIVLGTGRGSAEAARRLHLVLDGTGVLAEVGGRSVLAVHGNEVDRWNPVDFERVREIARDLQLGRPVPPWIPNAGARMVIDVMNEVKKDFPFVDLLKPETGAVGPVLQACGGPDLATLDQITELAMVVGARMGASLRKPRGMLGGEDEAASAAGGRAPAAPRVAPDRDAIAAQLLNQADEANARDVDPMALVERLESEQLGKLGALWRWVKGEPTSEVLREALEKLDTDRSFALDELDDTARMLDEQTSPRIDFLVAGHTHLARARRRLYGSGVYFNSGTWARLIRIAPEVRRDPDAFRKLFELLKHGDMKALDAAPGVVHKLNTVVEIRTESNGVVGRLGRVVDDGAGGFKLEAVDKSTFTLTKGS